MDQRQAQKKAVQHLVAGLSSFEDRRLFTDYAIKCGERTWNVHRIIVSIHSPVLAEACRATFEDARSRRYIVNCSDEECVQALVDYFYDLNYNEPNQANSAGNPMSFHILMATVAKSLDMPQLIDLASAKFEDSLYEQLGRKSGPDRGRIGYACILAYDCKEYGAQKIYDSAITFLADHTKLLEIEEHPAERNPLVLVLRTNRQLGRDVVAESQRRTNKAKLAALNAGY